MGFPVCPDFRRRDGGSARFFLASILWPGWQDDRSALFGEAGLTPFWGQTGCLGHCLAWLGRLLAQGIRVATAHTGDVPDHLFPGLDVVLGGDSDLFHDR